MTAGSAPVVRLFNTTLYNNHLVFNSNSRCLLRKSSFVVVCKALECLHSSLSPVRSVLSLHRRRNQPVWNLSILSNSMIAVTRLRGCECGGLGWQSRRCCVFFDYLRRLSQWMTVVGCSTATTVNVQIDRLSKDPQRTRCCGISLCSVRSAPPTTTLSLFSCTQP